MINLSVVKTTENSLGVKQKRRFTITFTPGCVLMLLLESAIFAPKLVEAMEDLIDILYFYFYCSKNMKNMKLDSLYINVIQYHWLTTRKQNSKIVIG